MALEEQIPTQDSEESEVICSEMTTFLWGLQLDHEDHDRDHTVDHDQTQQQKVDDQEIKLGEIMVIMMMKFCMKLQLGKADQVH